MVAAGEMIGDAATVRMGTASLVLPYLNCMREVLHMNWGPDDARRICRHLIRNLEKAYPGRGWEAPDTHGEDGLVCISNSDDFRVAVTISREALSDYEKADEANKARKEQQLANCLAEIDKSGVPEALITSDHLAP